MKLKLLAAAASVAFISSGVAYAQDTTQKHDQRPAERAEPKTPAMAPKAEPAPRAAQAEPRDQKEAPKAAETDKRAEPGKPQPKAAEMERKDQPKAAEIDRKDTPKQAEVKPNGEAPRAAEGQRAGERDPKAAEGERHEGGAPRVMGNVKISNEHATRLGEVLRRGARPERVDIDVRVGQRVPETVVIRPLPPEVLTLVPEYRGYNYFVGPDDEIVFVSPESHEIVGSIGYEARAAAMDDQSVRPARPCPVEN